MTEGKSGRPAAVDGVPSLANFGARLALLRWHMGWNQKEAAVACGLSQASWRGWEVDGRDPRNIVDVVGKICRATDVDDYWLLTGKTRETKNQER